MLKLASTTSFKSTSTDNGFYIEGYASTAVIDRDEEIIAPGAIDVTEFQKNPIILYQHDRDKPIGKVVEYKTDENGFWIKAFISEAAEKAYHVITLIKDGILKAFSVGFSMEDYKINPDGVLTWTKINLHEISIVSIPANPDALFAEVKSYSDKLLVKGAIPFKSYGISDADTWNGAEEMKKANGEKDYKAICAWVDSNGNPNERKSYKLPHHQVSDYKAVWKGVTSAMAALLGARGGVDIDDKEKVYNHLAKHYKEFDKTPPAFKEYTEDELKQLFPDEYSVKESNKKSEEELMELKELQEKLARLEKEKAEREKAEKEAKEKAEKEALIKSVEEVNEELKKISETYETEKAKLTEEIKTLKEDIEALKKVKATIPVADEKTKSHFLNHYKDAWAEAQLFKRKFTDTKVFQKLPAQAKAINFDAEFQTMVNDEIISDIKQNAPVFDLLSKKTSNTLTDVYPFDGGVTASWGTLTLTDWDLTGKISFDYKSVLAGVEYKYSDEDEAIISWMPKLRSDILEAIGEATDAAIIASLTDGTAFKGFLGYATDNASTQYTMTETDNKLTAAEVAQAKALMKKYGVKPKDTILIVNSYKYSQLVTDPDVATVDKLGNLATLITGSLGQVYGTNIIVNDATPGEDTASDTTNGIYYYSGLLANIKMFAAKAKPPKIEFDKDIQTQNKVVVGSMRVSAIPLIPLASGALPDGYPITVALVNA